MKPLSRSIAAVAAATAFAWLCGAAFGASQLFKCVDGGRTVYQQQACPVSSQAEPASAAPRLAVRTSAAATEAPASAPPRKVKPTSPASSAPATPR